MSFGVSFLSFFTGINSFVSISTHQYYDAIVSIVEPQCTISDSSMQNLHGLLQQSASCHYLTNFKVDFCFEPYLTNLLNYRYRKALSQFRLRSNSLLIATKHRNTTVNDCMCILCDLNEEEDEYHVLFRCTFYNSLRVNIFPFLHNCSKNLYQFNLIMSSEPYQYHLSKFVFHAMKKRKEFYALRN